MARTLRIEHPGAIHQVMNRGDRRAAMFRDDPDGERFPATPAGAGGKAGSSSPRPKSNPVKHPFMSREPIEPKPAVDGGGGPLRGRATIKKRQICKYQEPTPLGVGTFRWGWAGGWTGRLPILRRLAMADRAGDTVD